MLLAICYLLSVISHPLSVIIYLLSAMLLVICYLLSVISHPLSVIHYPLSVIRYLLFKKKSQVSPSEREWACVPNVMQLSVISHPLSVICYPLSVIRYQFSVICHYLLSKKKNSQVSPSESKRAWVSEWACVPNVMHNTPNFWGAALQSSRS